jgi:hypothetical protein
VQEAEFHPAHHHLNHTSTTAHTPHAHTTSHPHLHSIPLGDQDTPVPFKWSVAMESAVDSSFFWGYLITQVPGGFLASAYPANRIFGTAIFCSACLNLFLPGAFEYPVLIIMIKVLQGLAEVRIFALTGSTSS